MGKAIGRLCNLGIGKEASRGVGVAASYWVPKAEVSFDDKVTRVRSEMSFGNINQFGNQSLVAYKMAEGSIEGDVYDKSFGLLLYGLFGTLNSASFNGAYKHTLSIQDSAQHQSLSLYLDNSDGASTDLLFELAMIESMEITFVPDDTVKYSIEFKAKNSAGTTSTASYVAENKFLGRNLHFKIASDTSGLDAATDIPLKSLTLTISKNLEYDNVLGTVQPIDILNKQFQITGEIELDLEDRTYADYMLNGSYKAVRMDCVNDAVTIGSTNPAFRIDLSRVDFDSWEAQRGNDDIMKQTMEFNALYDITNGNVVNNAYIVNEVSSY